MSKQILFGEVARNELIKGIRDISKATLCTLGEKGRNVLFTEKDNILSPIKITKDGITVTKQFEGNVGSELIKQAAREVEDLVGDGTTTTTCLTNYLITNGNKFIQSGFDPIEVKDSMTKIGNLVCYYLIKTSIPVKDNFDLIKNVATTSSNNDSDLGFIIAQAFEQNKGNGDISIQKGNNTFTYLDMVEGMTIDRGYLSNVFITNKEKGICEFDNPYLLFCQDKISDIYEILDILNKALSANRPLIIFCKDMDGSALQGLIVNKLKGGLKVCVIKNSGFGASSKDELEDLAILTDSVVVSKEIDFGLENIQLESLGECSKIIISNKETTILGAKGKKEEIEERVEEIKSQMNYVAALYDKNLFQKRIAKLSGGIEVINIGGNNELEINNKKQIAEDALQCTSAAIDCGISIGGGSALIKISSLLPSKIDNSEDIGIVLVKEALKQPFIQLCKNAGIESELLIDKIINSGENMGYNLKSNELENLLESGIIDATKVLVLAITKAISVASIVLTTSVLIKEK